MLPTYPAMARGALISSLCLLLVLALTLGAARSRAQHAPDAAPQLTVNGRAEVSLVPDQASLSMSVSERGTTISALQRAVDQRIDQLLATVEDLGIDQKNIVATAVRIQPLYRYDQAQQRRIADGYEVQRSIELTLTELDKLGTLITEAGVRGATQINPPVLSSSAHEQAYQQALALAVRQARARAVVMAEAAGVQLGDLQTLSSSSMASTPVPIARMAAMADSEAGRYLPGELSVVAEVTAQYSLTQPE